MRGRGGHRLQLGPQVSPILDFKSSQPVNLPLPRTPWARLPGQACDNGRKGGRRTLPCGARREDRRTLHKTNSLVRC